MKTFLNAQVKQQNNKQQKKIAKANKIIVETFLGKLCIRVLKCKYNSTNTICGTYYFKISIYSIHICIYTYNIYF